MNAKWICWIRYCTWYFALQKLKKYAMLQATDITLDYRVTRSQIVVLWTLNWTKQCGGTIWCFASNASPLKLRLRYIASAVFRSIWSHWGLPLSFEAVAQGQIWHSCAPENYDSNGYACAVWVVRGITLDNTLSINKENGWKNMYFIALLAQGDIRETTECLKDVPR